MSKNKRFLIVFAVTVILCICSIFHEKLTIYAETEGNWEYSVINESAKTAKITGYTGSTTYLTVPSTLGEYTVVRIDEGVFKDNTSIRKATIEESVTYIGKNVFSGCTKLEEVILPSTLETIGNAAFQNCISLASIELPENLKKIQKETFDGCSKLQTLVIPQNVSEIGTNAFNGCDSLVSLEVSGDNNNFAIKDNMLLNYGKNKLIKVLFYNNPTYVNIPNSVNEIVGGAFYGCDRLVSINIPESVTTIPVNAFEKCTNLKKVTLHSKVTTISDYSFKDCTNLTTIVNLEDVSSIKSGAFYNCASLNNISISSSITTISSYMFYGCRSLESNVLHSGVSLIENNAFDSCVSLKSISIPVGVEKINEYAFKDCKGLSSVQLSNTVKTLDAYAFVGCSGLKSIELPEGMENITNNAFMNCVNLKSIYLSSTVKYIGSNVFVGCSSLENINVATDNNYFVSENGVLYSKDKDTIIRYPSAKKSKTFDIAYNITEIKEGAFESCSNLAKINVSTDNDYFFSEEGILYDKNKTRIICYPAGNTNSSFTISSDIRNINNNAFVGCKFLSEIKVLPEKFDFVGSGLFYGCDNMTKLIVSTSIDKCNFVTLAEGSNNLLNVEMFLGESNQIVDSFFDGNNNIKSVTIPDGVVRIGNCVFENCKNLKNVIIPESVTSIGYNAFMNCTSMEEIKLPDGITKLCSDTFRGCISLRTVELPEKLTYISKYVFYNCTSLENIVLPSELNTICASAFIYCSSLKKIAIPAGVTSIATATFANCSSLECVVIPTNVSSIAVNAFYNCENLTIYARSGSYAETYALSNDFNFEQSKIKEEFISLAKDVYAYTGEQIQPDVIIDFHGIILEKDIDYTCHYGENTNVGEGSVVVIGQGAYSYVNVVYFDIKYEINDITITEDSFVYDGKAKCPEVIVKYNNKKLVKGTDYTVAYKNNINTGKATVTIKGIGEYMGEIHMYFTINPKKISNVNLSKVKYTYDGKVKKPKVVVKDGTKVLVNRKDYTLTYSNNIKPGKASVIIKGVGNYSGTITKTFIIKPAGIKGLKQTKKYSEKYIKMSWKKSSGVDGYEIYRANSKNGRYKKVKSISKTSYKNTKLKAGNDYYYKVRAYIIIDGKKVYGAFSSKIKMITKTKAPSVNVKSIGANRAKLTWKKVSGASGYEIYMKTGTKSSYKKIKTVSSAKTTFTKTKLTKGKKYSFKIKAYIKVGNKKVYSTWSNVKSLKL